MLEEIKTRETHRSFVEKPTNDKKLIRSITNNSKKFNKS